VLAVFTLLALVPQPASYGAGGALEPFDLVAARAEHFAPPAARELSKKETWLREKGLRPDVHTTEADLERAALAQKKVKPRPAGKKKGSVLAALADVETVPGQRIEPLTTLYNVWTREALPILPGQNVASLAGRFHPFLRDHYTNQATRMDTRLIDVLRKVASKFSAKRIEVVSGYRSPQYNLKLRKKGHQVARHSQHMEGTAVDFRIRGVATKVVLHFVKAMRLGGVGFYPHSQFVHSDTGPIRYWTGS
jgi:uncharacterized protein YcbK (DUF882 family)